MSGNYDPSHRWTRSSGTNPSSTSTLNVKSMPSHKSHNHRHGNHGNPNSNHSKQLINYELDPLEFRRHGCFDFEQSVCGYQSCATRGGYQRFVQHNRGNIVGMGAVRDIEHYCCILPSMASVQGSFSSFR